MYDYPVHTVYYSCRGQTEELHFHVTRCFGKLQRAEKDETNYPSPLCGAG